MPRKKVPKPPLFSPYTIQDDEGNEYLVDQPLIPPPKHHKQEKEKRAKLAIVRDVLKSHSKWNLKTASKFARSAEGTGLECISGDDSALRKGYKKVLGMLSVFK